MKKRVFYSAACLVVGCFILSFPASAENIETYSDEIVSFDYDSDFQASITRYDNGDISKFYPTSYYASANMLTTSNTDDGGFSISVGSISAATEEFKDWKSFAVPSSPEGRSAIESVDVISDGDFPESFVTIKPSTDENGNEKAGYSYYVKFLGSNEKYFVTASYQPSSEFPDQDVFFKEMYDSIQISDSFLSDGYSPSDEWDSTDILLNVVYSDQALNYAKELVRIGKGYLDFSIQSDDAYNQVKEVYDRFASYCETSEYMYDSKLRHAAFGIDSKISSKNDSDVINIVRDLQDLIDSQEDK